MNVRTSQSRCRFGLAIGDITPPVGTYHRMWGAARHDESEGVHRPLRATISYFGAQPADEGDETADHGDAQLLIALDHCLLDAAEVEAIRTHASDRSGVPFDSVVITFSHTHAAGLLNRDRQHLPGGHYIPEYFIRLVQQAGLLAEQACAAAQAATIVYGHGSCRLAAHRDFYDEDLDEWVCGYNPSGPADDTVVVARVNNEHGRLLATFVNYACHPTTLAWDNRLISPDYPGAARDLVERAIGAPCVFLQGASGDLGPVEGFVGDVSVADRNGRQLGYAALSVLEGLPPADTDYVYDGPVVSGATIGVWKRQRSTHDRLEDTATWRANRETTAIEYRDDLPSRETLESERQALLAQEEDHKAQGRTNQAAEVRALVERKTRMLGRMRGLPEGDSYPFEATVWRMGDAIWVVVQGEPYQQLQVALRERFPETPIVLATIGNGWGPSYIPPSELYGKGMYQESIASLAPGSLEKLIHSLGDRIHALLN